MLLLWLLLLRKGEGGADEVPRLLHTVLVENLDDGAACGIKGSGFIDEIWTARALSGRFGKSPIEMSLGSEKSSSSL